MPRARDGLGAQDVEDLYHTGPDATIKPEGTQLAEPLAVPGP
jgi:hypothetical protein